MLSDKNHWQHDVVKNLNFEEGFINSLTIKTKNFQIQISKNLLNITIIGLEIENEVENSKNIKRSGMRDTMKTQKSLLKKSLILPISTSLMKKKLKIN